ncbi:MAG: PKD domain-containing protein [Bacteroidetes bacterium]|nr:PKD domain-containing protein [Bacteroidota bacterium]
MTHNYNTSLNSSFEENRLPLKRPFEMVKRVLGFKATLLALVLSCSNIAIAQTYTFTNCGATGRLGPTQGQVNTTYGSTTLNGQVTSYAGIQSWHVPDDGTYQITVAGAKGGDKNSGSLVGGKGAIMEGVFDLNAGEEIWILVGQSGNTGSGGGGGGATYVVNKTTGTILIVAGGGGGAMNQDGKPGLKTNNGTQNGGAAQGVIATSGGGYKLDGNLGGSASSYGITPGKSFLNGGEGGKGSSSPSSDGGFGGGGGCHASCGGSCGAGGGGGYNGGDQVYDYGLGGGSYNSGLMQNNVEGGNNGQGYAEFITLATKNSDIEVVNVQPVIVNAPGILCHNNEYDIDVTLTSNGPGKRSFVDVSVAMPGAAGITIKFFDISTLEVGTTKTFRIPNYKLKPTLLGNQPLTFTVLSSDQDNTNNTKVVNFDVTTLPSGSDFIPDVSFPGFPKSGSPDLVTHDKTFIYHFSPPTGYSNTGYGTTWSAKFAATIDNEPLPTNRYTFNPPSGSNNAYVSVKFKEEDVDKAVNLIFTVSDKTYGKCDSTIIRDLHVAPMPKVATQDAGGCLGTVLQFVNLTEIASGTIISTKWDFGDGTTSTDFAPQKTYSSKGFYTVKMVATSDLGFADSVIKVVEVIESPVAGFTFENQCGSTPMQFNNTSTIAVGVLSYTWDFGDETTSTDNSPTHIYNVPGPYEVTLTTTSDKGCANSVTKSVYNYPNSVPNFDLPVSICANQTVNILNKTTIPFSSWGSEWSSEHSNRTFDKNPTLTFSQAGQQWVKLKVTTQFGCVDSIVKMANVIPGPGIDISYSDVCSNTPVTFHSGIQKPNNIQVDYFWNVGGSLSAKSDPTFNIGKAGKYNVNLTVTYDNACAASKSIVVETGYRPLADFSLADVNCAGSPISVSNNTTISFGKAVYYWDMGDGATYNQMITPNHTYTNATPTQYTITLVATSENGVCPDTVSKNIMIGVVPSCNFNITHDWTYGQRGYTFEPEQAGAEYKWYFGDGLLSTQKSPVHQFPRDSKFPVKLIVTSPEGCQCEKTLDLVVENLDVKSDFALSGFAVYPNPSTGVITITNHNNTAIANISISNMLGATMMSKVESNSNSEYSFDLSGLANGVYMVKIVTADKQVLTHKVVISK